jgi:hypothetical protein
VPEIDLEKPGKITASAENAKDYTFLLVLDKASYTPQAFEKDLNTAPESDVLFKQVVPDQGGHATADLAPKAKEIKDKLKEIATAAKLIVVATAKPDNQDPQKKMAVGETYTVKKPKPELKLTPEKKHIPLGAKGGLKVEFRNLDKVDLKLEPADVLSLDKPSLEKPGAVTLEAKKDGKATLTATGKQGETTLTEKLELEGLGPTVKVGSFGIKA